jgi:hypothetical protein
MLPASTTHRDGAGPPVPVWRATYLIEFVAMPAVGDTGRGIYPQLLTTVTVDPGP